MPQSRSLATSAAILLVLIVGVAGLAYVISTGQAKVYMSTAYVRFETEHPELQLVGFQVAQPPDDRVEATDAMVAASPPVVANAAQLLGVTPSEVSDNLAIEPAAGVNAVVLQATGSTPQKALRLASTYVTALISTRHQVIQTQAQAVVRHIRDQLAVLEGNRPAQATAFTVGLHGQIATETALPDTGYGVPQVLVAPKLPTTAASPHTQRNAAFGALFGLLLGIGIITLMFRSSRRNGGGGGEPGTQVTQSYEGGVPVGTGSGEDWHRRP
jgi:hypothetical protein